MVTLRVIVDSALEGSPRGIARYAEELTRALIATAPQDCDVEGVVSAAPDAEHAALLARLPGLRGLHKTVLSRRELYAAWQHGISTVPLHGMVHSTTLLAPLRGHDRNRLPGEQTVVTIHDASPWLHPDSAGDRGGWVRAMAKRARKHADAVVVPSHAVATDLAQHIDFGERVRVIGGAPSLVLPEDRDAIAARLKLPGDYLVAMSGLQRRKALEVVLEALALPGVPDLPLVVVGPDAHGGRTLATAVMEAGLPAERVHAVGVLEDAELAVVLDGAAAYVMPSLSEGFGLSVVEAFSLGTPVICSDAPALVEIADGAAVLVAREPGAGYAERFAAAITETLSDSDRLGQLSVLGLDRSRAFSWRDSGEKVWQLHADL
ncbi:glycosyltransferase family 4 protein [Naasia aerilata]|uniref:Glycosyl transferase n=1 Tax=Naasia aerilata TaxID=1162966 RepID=A0ABM8GCC4_9MICO|nr:glycosyltransferase family 1 protein [Naasia aerilata]BDZ45898.1 glycosyl transferase [Naasia aerilata]